MHGAFINSNDNSRTREGGHGPEFVLVPATKNGEIEATFNHSDINEIQLAKGAMRTGVKSLLEKAGLEQKDIDTVIIARAFGTYLAVQIGIDIGVFPKIAKDKFIQVGKYGWN